MYLYNLKRTYHETRPRSVTLSGPCFITQKEYQVTVLERELQNYESGALAQIAFPNLSSDEREFIISGVSPGQWDGLFQEDEK